MRNIWKASLNSAAAATRERHNKVQNRQVEAAVPSLLWGGIRNVIAPPGASRRNHHYICCTNQEAPHVFIP
jgi:hypothetical protein